MRFAVPSDAQAVTAVARMIPEFVVLLGRSVILMEPVASRVPLQIRNVLLGAVALLDRCVTVRVWDASSVVAVEVEAEEAEEVVGAILELASPFHGGTDCLDKKSAGTRTRVTRAIVLVGFAATWFAMQ